MVCIHPTQYLFDSTQMVNFPSREDRRVVKIDLTAQGKELVAQAPEIAQDMLVKGLDELSNEQFICVEEGMKLMAKVLGAERLIPQPLHS